MSEGLEDYYAEADPDPLKHLTPEQWVAIDAERDAAVRKKHDLWLAEKKKRRHIEKKLVAAEQRYDDALCITSGEVARPPLPKITAKVGVTSPAAAILNWSDWHVDNVISLEGTDGLNEFSTEIAWKRVHALIQRSIWQIKAWQRLSDMDTIVIAALGDWIAGDIHEELEQTCLPPQEATRIVREMHEWALTELHKIKGIERIRYIGMPDNHGRDTPKYQWTNGAHRSHNWGMYHALESWARGSGLDKIEFSIPSGSIAYEEVMGYTFRLMHGHQFRGNPGTAGTRGMKAIERLDKGRPADYTLVGHYHTARDHGALIMNGSLCGPDAYSVQNMFVSEKPVQLMLLVRPDYGVCDVSKIFPVPKDES